MRGRLTIVENMLVEEDLRNFSFSVDNLVGFVDEEGKSTKTP